MLYLLVGLLTRGLSLKDMFRVLRIRKDIDIVETNQCGQIGEAAYVRDIITTPYMEDKCCCNCVNTF